MPTSANIAQYAKMVKEKAILRNLMHVATEIVEKGYEVDTNVDAFMDEAERMIFQIAEKKYKPSFFSIKDLVWESMKTIESVSSKIDGDHRRAHGLHRSRQTDRGPPALRLDHRGRKAEYGQRLPSPSTWPSMRQCRVTETRPCPSASFRWRCPRSSS